MADIAQSTTLDQLVTYLQGMQAGDASRGESRTVVAWKTQHGYTITVSANAMPKPPVRETAKAKKKSKTVAMVETHGDEEIPPEFRGKAY